MIVAERNNKENNVVTQIECLNQRCLLNKDCKCRSEQINLGVADCYGKTKVTNKVSEDHRNFLINEKSSWEYNNKGKRRKNG